ncbi:MAG: YCII domain protein [Chlorobi bacterium OLB5]|nr:MAG: YCII domain protein [Chlorobi bacterium OLB5]
MKTKYCNILVSFLSILIFIGSIKAQNDSSKSKEEVKWEMKIYYFVFLNAVKDRPKLDSAEAMEIQKGHIANLERMYYEGKSKLAGPFMDGGEMRGIVILDVASEEEARSELSRDPAIIKGRLEAVIKQWYGPAGLYVEPKARE